MFIDKYFTTRLLMCLLTLLTGMVSTGVIAANGGLSLGQTRVIFNGDRQSVKVTLSNQSDSVYLISASIQKTPEVPDVKERLPFLVTPPLFRLEAGNRNSVLIMRGDTSGLPKDRESVFYLSFLAIPPVSVNEDKNDARLQPRVSVGLRPIIKLFYRPDNLKITADSAAEHLEFSQGPGVLHVNNLTPYYLTLATLSVNGSPVNLREQRNMIPPFASADYESHENARKVSWSVINDYGSESKVYHSVVFNKDNQ